MRLHSFLGRLALPVALIGLTTIGASAPAQAEPTFPSFGPLVAISFLDDQVTVINGKTKSVTVDYENIGDVDAHDVVVGFDTGSSKLDPSFGFTAPGGCESGTCVIGDIPAGTKVSRTFSFKPTAPGSLSIVDKLGLTVSNDGGPVDSDELRASHPDWAQRVDDHATLTSDDVVRELITQTGAVPISFRGLRDLQRSG